MLAVQGFDFGTDEAWRFEAPCSRSPKAADCDCGGACGGCCGGACGSCGSPPGAATLALPDYDGQLMANEGGFASRRGSGSSGAAFLGGDAGEGACCSCPPGGGGPSTSGLGGPAVRWGGPTSSGWFCCNVGGRSLCGYPHPSGKSVCSDPDLELCQPCDLLEDPPRPGPPRKPPRPWQPDPCPQWCKDQAGICLDADRTCSWAAHQGSGSTSGNGYAEIYNACIDQFLSEGGACSNAKVCQATFVGCPFVAVTRAFVPPPPRWPPDFDPDKNWCTSAPDWDANFAFCCYKHDKCYDMGGTEADRTVCDDDLKNCIQNEASTSGLIAWILVLR